MTVTVVIMMECRNCGREWPEDRFNPQCATPDWCFACRSKTIRTGFQGGKQYFHEDTEANRARLAVDEARKAGFDPVPYETGKGWNGVSASTLKTVGETSKKVGAFGGKPATAGSVG